MTATVANSPEPALIAVDVGQTGTRVTLLDGGRRSHAEVQLVAAAGPEVFAETWGVQMLTDEIKRLAPTKQGRVAVSLSGFDMRESYQELGEVLLKSLAATQVVVASDAFAAASGALRGDAGVCVTWGTGVVAVAADGDGQFWTVDGRGHLLGDLGGGSWVGRRGLIAGLDYFEGRGGSLQLSHALRQRFGTPQDLRDCLDGTANPASLLASFVPDVVAGAEAGDKVAARILLDASHEVVATMRAALANVQFNGRLMVTGGMAQEGAPHLTELRRLVQSEFAVSAEVAPDAAIDGALVLAAQAADLDVTSPLFRVLTG